MYYAGAYGNITFNNAIIYLCGRVFSFITDICNLLALHTLESITVVTRLSA